MGQGPTVSQHAESCLGGGPRGTEGAGGWLELAVQEGRESWGGVFPLIPGGSLECPLLNSKEGQSGSHLSALMLFRESSGGPGTGNLFPQNNYRA